MAELVIESEGLTKMQRWLRQAEQAGGGPQSNPVRIMLRRWGARYLAFTQRRYYRYSRGGGDWPALKPATVSRRTAAGTQRFGAKKGQRVTLGGSRQRALRMARITTNPKRARRAVKALKAIGGAKASILIDTTMLVKSLEPGARGNLIDDISQGVDVGFSPAIHPSGAGVTFGQLAMFHHFGRGNNPERTILVEPDQQTLSQMGRDAQAAGVDIERRIGQ